jgi:hypothetical protein
MKFVEVIRRVFQKEMITIFPDGFLVSFQSARENEPDEATQCIEGEDLDILRSIVSISESVQIAYEDGVSASLRFNIPGFSDGVRIFVPVSCELSDDDLQGLLDNIEKMDYCQEFVEVFSDADIGECGDAVKIYVDFLKSMNKHEAYDLGARLNWSGFLAKARMLSNVMREFEFYAQPPTELGLCYVTLSGPMYDDSDGFSILLSGKDKDGLSDLLDVSSECDFIFCCNNEYSAIDITFFA